MLSHTGGKDCAPTLHVNPVEEERFAAILAVRDAQIV